ncbi:MAG: 2OG-Fe(II) oxygenase [Rheinheimera sp.]|nr:2OG-Fe(II) oxygenase [Rheinheimera sp.]
MSQRSFCEYLRSDEFMAVLSRIFAVELTDRNVAKPDINCNYFRLGPDDFVNQHADDSPGREVCMLLYLNENWNHQQGGELVFSGKYQKPVRIAPLYNRCVLFDPSSKGAEHWVNPVHRLANDDQAPLQCRYMSPAGIGRNKALPWSTKAAICTITLRANH